MATATEQVSADLDHYLHRYTGYAWANSIMYWLTRAVVVGGGVLLPFVVKTEWASSLAIAIAIGAVVDTIFHPADRWKFFSDVYDEPFLVKAQLTGAYAEAPNLYDSIKRIESRLEKGRDKLDKMVDQAKTAAKRAKMSS